MSNVDFAILLPIPEEYMAMVSRIEPSDSSLSLDQTMPSKYGKIGKFNVVCINSGKGEGYTSAVLTWVLLKYEPKFVLLVGIAGSLGHLDRGDIAVVSYVFALYGKTEDKKFVHQFECDWKPDAYLIKHALLFIKEPNQTWVKNIRVSRPDGNSTIFPKAEDVWIASSDLVIDDIEDPIFREIKAAATRQDIEIDAVEMEGAGAGAAAYVSRGRLLMIRSISDKCGEGLGWRQRKVWKEYACDTVASFVEEFLKYLPEQYPHPNEVKQSLTYQSNDITLKPEKSGLLSTIKPKLSNPVYIARSAVRELAKLSARAALILPQGYEVPEDFGNIDACYKEEIKTSTSPLGLIIAGEWPHWEIPVRRGFEGECSRKQYNVVVAHTAENEIHWAMMVEKFRHSGVKGIACVPPAKTIWTKLRLEVLIGDFPYVELDRQTGHSYPIIRSEDFEGSRDIIVRAANKGKIDSLIIVTFSNEQLPMNRDRTIGARAAATLLNLENRSHVFDLGLPTPTKPNMFPTWSSNPYLENYVTGLKKTERVVFFATTAPLAKYLHELVEKVRGEWPHRWAITQFDSTDESGLKNIVECYGARQQTEELGRMAALCLIELVENHSRKNSKPIPVHFEING
ncbi:MAG: hypothetical protein WC562_02025 [Dehalococcoidia bacterium]